ncbi:RNA polymerase-associated protein RapA [Marinomonas agarivorans]|nr:RNA polymerase-associated protein RapA [Marinomonas agarivorans]
MYQLGQRWSSRNEADLGVGIITKLEAKSFTLYFIDAEIERQYADTQTSLVRRTLTQGDELYFQDDAFQVKAIREVDGLIEYQIEDKWLKESVIQFPRNDKNELDALLSLSPAKRMWFDLRRQTLEYKSKLATSDVRGLMGLKAELLPHQIYLANEIANRPTARALLCDEVGMGKTLEAGLILHHRMLNGLCKRALILTPTNLQHQWLVEMLRRFHQHFSLINESAYDEQWEEEENLFEDQPLVIAPIDWLANTPKAAEDMLSAEWDLVIIDEAHHLSWHPEAPSNAYQIAAALAAKSESLLLLSATPEQTGEQEHFSRLQLLDPESYHNFERYQEQQAEFQQAADLAELLLPLTENTAHLDVSKQDWQTLFAPYHDQVQAKDWYQDLLNGAEKNLTTTAQDAINWLIDRHGTGREVFRNTRAAIGGFPKRILTEYPLASNEVFDQLQNTAFPQHAVTQAQWGQDPRWEWLKEFLECQADKVLVICHDSDMAQWLSEKLTFAGFQSADFHEQMTLIQRDRAAAYFADPDGAQVLVCSEIGSEGRNFQFSHNLVMYDLPEHPDLLEQRIGRLDRLGQAHDVLIHVPYIKNSKQERLFHWYHKALNAFCHTTPCGDNVNHTFKDSLHSFLHGNDEDSALLDEAKAYHQALLAQLDEGRNRLLELSSCRPEQAKTLIEKIENTANEGLSDYIEKVTHAFNIHTDRVEKEGDDSEWFIRPSTDMMLEALPGIEEEGKTLVLDRRKASQREDVAFATWEHPLITMLMDEVQTFDSSRLTASTLPIAALPEGTVLIESMFVIEANAQPRLRLKQSLPMIPIWQLSDTNGKFLHAQFTPDKWAEKLNSVPNRVAEQWVAALRQDLIRVLQEHQLNAYEQARPIIQNAKQHYQHKWQGELDRLLELKKQNRHIKESEIDRLTTNLQEGLARMDDCQIRLDAIRLILTTKPEA